MRIALTHAYGWPEVRRGAERYTHELGAALLRAGHDVRIVIGAPSAGRDQVLGVPVRRVRRRAPRMVRDYGELGAETWFGAQALARLGAARIDVWHAMSPASAAAATAASTLRPGLRSVYTEVGFPRRQSRELRSDHVLYRRMARRVDEFVCLSEPAGQMLLSDYGRPGQVVPAGVDLATFRPGEGRSPQPLLLFPGDAGESRKNVVLFLEAVALIRRSGTPVEAWLAGPGRLPDQLSPLAVEGLSAVSRSELLGADELIAAYQRAWVTVLPARSEVFGLVVLESLACGTPAVVLDDGLGPASIVTAGTGVATTEDAQGIADGCLAAIGLAESSATAGQCAAVAQSYSWDDVVVPRLLEIYRG